LSLARNSKDPNALTIGARWLHRLEAMCGS